MKNINAVKGITKILSRASIILFVLYVLSTMLFRAGNMESVTSDDACRFVLFGLLTVVMAISDYVVGVIRNTLRRQRRISSIKAKEAKTCTIITLKPEYINSKKDDFRMIS